MVATLRWIGVMVGSTVLALLLIGAAGSVALVAWDRAHPPTLPGLDRKSIAPAPGLPAKRPG